MSVAEIKIKHPYVSRSPKISGGQPVISGTRIKVMDVAIRYELLGWSADKIVDEYPNLKLEQIHDALSYYHEHKEMFNQRYRDDQDFINEIKKQYPSRLKAKLK